MKTHYQQFPLGMRLAVDLTISRLSDAVGGLTRREREEYREGLALLVRIVIEEWCGQNILPPTPGREKDNEPQQL